MRRRRLTLHYSSDEEEDEHQKQQDHQQQQQQAGSTETLIAGRNPNSLHTPAAPVPLEISDDDFLDADGSISPSSPPHPPPPPTAASDPIPIPFPHRSSTISSGSASYSPVGALLQNLGLRLRTEWLDSCISGLNSSVPGFSNLDVSGKAELCFAQFLFSDMNLSGAGVLPENVHTLHLTDLPGPYVLQVDEIVNISRPLQGGRYENEPAGIKRCLKLSMTDGVQRVFGMEYRPIKDLQVLAPAGLKVAIHNVHVRRGLLVLVPEVLHVLGGLVEDLQAARQRLVHEVNKPPRGRRTQTGSVPSLASRATHAAWSSSGVNDHWRSNTSTPQQTGSFGRSDQGASLGSDGVSTTEQTAEHQFVPNARSNAESDPLSRHVVDPQEAMIDASTASFGDDRDRIAEAFAESSVRPSATFSTSSVDTRGLAEGHLVPNVRSTPNSSSYSFIQPEEANMIDPHMRIDEDDIEMVAEAFADSGVTSNAEPDQSLDAVSGVRDTDMADEAERLPILNGDKEVPFTYLASLNAIWTTKYNEDKPSIQGKIKCVLTGVKDFQYRGRDTFELRVHVDDGGLISEIVIDHNVVQAMVGHSPKEVMAALSSKDSIVANGMRENMRQFQRFLINFEGIMLVEIKRDSLPVALEMNQGCSPSDTWLLLRRLQTITSPQTPPHQHLEPIDAIEISP